jgi:N-acetylmuramic acid 6-phosphate etherase
MSDDLACRLTEQRNPRSAGIDTKSARDILEAFHEEDRVAVAAVEGERDHVARAVEWVAAAFAAGGRLLYVGAGTSGRLGVLDASECPPTFGVSPELVVGIIAGGDMALRQSVEGAEDSRRAGAEAIRAHAVGPPDVVVGIATSGRTPFVLGALGEAHRRRAKTVLLSCTPPESSLSRFVDGFITPLVGPELITGSTRLKAGTATKLVLNQLTTTAMILTGKVYDNWMVNVQPTNSKLRARARRIVMDIAGCGRRAAQAALDEAEGDVKVAVMMVSRRLAAGGARLALEQTGGNLRRALEPASPDPTSGSPRP